MENHAGVTEYIFKIRSADNLLCRFTGENPDVRILINLMRPSAHASVAKAIVTILAPRRTRQRFLVGEFGKRYGTFDVLSEGDHYASVEISTEVLNYYQRHDPIQLTIRMLGPETIFNPVVVEDGYIVINVMSPNPQGIEAFNAFTKHMRQMVPADDFKLLHVGEYQPDARYKGKARAITPRQEEVLRLAVAMGYYSDPRGCTLDELATSMGVSKAAVHKRLQLAENNLIRRHVDAS